MRQLWETEPYHDRGDTSRSSVFDQCTLPTMTWIRDGIDKKRLKGDAAVQHNNGDKYTWHHEKSQIEYGANKNESH